MAHGSTIGQITGMHTPVSSSEPAWRASLKHGLDIVFLRDWHPVLRDPLDLFRLSFPIGAVIFAIQGDWDATVRLLAPGLAVFIVRAIDVPRPIDWVFCAAMFFQGWGNALHLFSEFWWYDNLVHITLPMSLAPILYIGFSRLDAVPALSERTGSQAQLLGMALVTMCLGVTAASFYEIYEWVVDHWFGQHLFIGETDTVTDLADGFLGAGIGGLFLAAWALTNYTDRRLPRPLHDRLHSAHVDRVGQQPQAPADASLDAVHAARGDVDVQRGGARLDQPPAISQDDDVGLPRQAHPEH
jgi:hypothetical protein